MSRYRSCLTTEHARGGAGDNPYQLSPSSTIHGILPIQSTCSTVFFHNLRHFLLQKMPRRGRSSQLKKTKYALPLQMKQKFTGQSGIAQWTCPAVSTVFFMSSGLSA